MISKLLLLGAGESGKSTLFKQMVCIYGVGFSEAARREYRPIIHNNVITSIKTLIEQGELLEEHGKVQGKCSVGQELRPLRDRVVELKQGEDTITPEIGGWIKRLWKDVGIQNAYLHRARFQLTDSAAYFFDQVDVVADLSYVPTEQDVLRSRVRTTGIVESNFLIEGNTFQIFDVGGQRNERKKWIHCFSEVTAVLFVAALSEYDMVLFEDETTNRMEEALNLFDEICNSLYFRRTSMILMLNKKDLFQQKIQSVPLTVWDPDFPGPNEYEPAALYIQDKFVDRNKYKNKTIYCHLTCATDTQLMKQIFHAVKDTIIRRSLEDNGLLT